MQTLPQTLGADAFTFAPGGTARRILSAVCTSLFLTFAGIAQGNALKFDGVNDVVSVPASSSIELTQGTWEAWIKVATFSHHHRVIFKEGGDGNGKYELYILSDGTVHADVVVGSVRSSVTTGSIVTAGTWYHVAASYDGSKLRIYVNGVVRDSVTVGGSIDANTGPLGIGGNISGDAFALFEGSIDEVRIWNVVRTEAQIAGSLSSFSLSPSTTGLVALYQFNQGTAGGTNTGVSSLADSTSNANHGTLLNFALTGSTSNWTTSLRPVSAVSPANNAVYVAPGTTIQATFAYPVLPGSFNDTTSFRVSGSVSGRHRGTIVLSAGNTVATFTPTVPFVAGERVEVALTSNLQSASSIPLSPHVSSFTVRFSEALGALTFDRSYTTGDSPFGIGVGDMDGDGYGDLVVTNTWTTGVSTFRHLANGYFSSKVDYQTGSVGGGSTYAFSAVVADINGDGAGDLVVGNCNSTKLSILLNNGDGTFAARTDYAAGAPSDVAVSDLDGDGDLDVAMADKGSTAARVYLNNGDGTLAAGVTYTAGSTTSGMVVSDIDNDGDQDLITANEGTTTLSVFKNHGNGTFAAAVTLTGLSYPLGVDAQDVNGDGFTDLVCGNQGAARVSVFLNDGTGGFGSVVNYTTSGSTYGAQFGDIDGDGDQDIVAAVSGGYLATFPNNGDGSFGTRVDLSTYWTASRLVIADLDRNGVADVAATYGGPDLMYVFRGLGAHDAILTTPTNITASSATLNGTVSVGGDTAVVRFLIGTASGTYTDSVLAAQSPVADSAAASVSGSVAGLNGQTTYYIRLAAAGQNWYVRSHEWSFSTSSADSTSGFAMSFDGVNDYINVPYHSTLNPTQFTVELWARVDGGSGQWRTPIASRRSNGGNQFGYNMYATTTNRWAAWIGPGGTTWCGLDGGPVTTGAWTHLAMTHDGTNFRFFVNGVLTGDTVVAFSANTANPLRFGSISDAVNFFFNGRIDEVRVWNIARDSTAIRQTMHRVITTPTPNLVGNWHFNEGSGTTATDSDSGRVGTLTNFDASGSYTWPASTIPAGSGTSASVSSFTNGTANLGPLSLATTDPFDAAVELTATQLTATPNVLPVGFASVIGNATFLINAFGAPGTFAADLTITYGAGVLDPRVDADPQSLRLYTRPSSSDGAWTEIGGAISANSSTGEVTWGGLTSFSQFAAVFQESALPVQMVEMNAEVISGESAPRPGSGQKVRLSWRTASEVDNAGWEVERRAIGDLRPSTPLGTRVSSVDYQTIGFVEGAGTSSAEREYTFTDHALFDNRQSQIDNPTRFAYRLKQLDRSGSFSYSHEVEVEIGTAPREFTLSQNYPNPFNPTTTMEFTLAEDGHATLEVFDLLGRLIATLHEGPTLAGRRLAATFDARDLPSGLYVARLRAGSRQIVKKLTLLK